MQRPIDTIRQPAPPQQPTAQGDGLPGHQSVHMSTVLSRGRSLGGMLKTLSAMSPRKIALGLTLLFLAGFGPRSVLEHGFDQMYVGQAEAFLQGRLDLPRPYGDVSVYGGKFYCAFPPLPSVLLMPLVLLLGTGVNGSLILTLLLVPATTVMLHRTVGTRLGLPSADAAWVTAAFTLGTGFWMVAMRSSGVWFLAHTTALFCCVATICEAMGRRRAWLLGLLVGGAFLSRQLTAFYALFVVAILWNGSRDEPLKSRLAHVARFALVLGVVVSLQLALNTARFSGPFDSGYSYMSANVAEEYGMFSPRYFLRNAILTYFNGPYFDIKYDQLGVEGMSGMGTSLTFASPFVFLAFRAQSQPRLLIPAVLVILIVGTIQLFYHNNGYYQTNCSRFTLDFMPLLVMLVALGWRQWHPKIARATVVYAVGLNVFALVIAPRIF